jgi:hypothetical protein
MTRLKHLMLFSLLVISMLLAPTRPAAFNPGYPRLGMWWPDVWSQPLSQIARYDWVIYDDSAHNQAAQVKALNPNQLALNSTNACELSFDDSEPAGQYGNAEVSAIPAEWFLTQVGTTLKADVNATQTTFSLNAVTVSGGGQTYDLFKAGEAAVIGWESVKVLSVNKSAKTITVQRGYVRPASSHPAGTRIAAHITFWPGSWLLNLSTQSPIYTVDAGIGPENWAEFHARSDAHLLDRAVWDGMLIDRADPDESWLIGNSTARTIDPNQSNTLPADGYAAFDAGWNAGLRQYESKLRQLVGPGKILFVNWGMANYDLLNGNNYEGFPLDSGWSYSYPWNTTVFGPAQDGSYFEWMAQAQTPNLTMIETYEDDGGPDPEGDGSYDNPCVKPGFVPNYRKMRFGLATALLNDGFFSYEINTNGHGSLCLLWFDEYDNAGQGRGYLGSPSGAATRAVDTLSTPNLVLGGGMENQADLDRWSFWTDTGYAGSTAIDAGTQAAGAASLRITITQAAGVDWQASLAQDPLALTGGADYTLSFWAKASAARPISAWAQKNSPAWDTWLDFGSFNLTTTWQRFEVSATAAGSDPLAALQFGLGQTTGMVWIDDVRLQAGSREVWRRDFANGISLVNASGSPQTIALGDWFLKIKGTQAPAINTGGLVNQVALPARDGIILLRYSGATHNSYLPLLAK